jgi:hypothetical protein
MSTAPKFGKEITMPNDTNRLQVEEDEKLDAIAKRIRPLPDNVVPSEFFVRQMRKRLLQLQPKGTSGRAA